MSIAMKFSEIRKLLDIKKYIVITNCILMEWALPSFVAIKWKNGTQSYDTK